MRRNDARTHASAPAYAVALTLLVGLAITMTACGSTPSSSAIEPTTTPAHTADTPSSAATPPDSVDPADSVPPVSQTDTEWGRIWDALPAGFPRHPGATPADDAGVGPVSAAYLIAAIDASEVADWLQSAMEVATFSTEALSGPFEDGGYVLDSVGAGACRVQTTVAPLGPATLVTVRYGAACPA